MMMKSLMIVVFLFSMNSFAQDADKILNDNYKVRGGVDKLTNIETIHVIGRIYTAQVDDWADYEYWAKGSKMVKLTQEIMGQKVTAAFNGKIIWQNNPLAGSNGPEIVEAKQASNLKPQLEQMRGQIKGMSLDHNILEAEFVGLEKENGKNLNNISITTDLYNRFNLYFDSKSKLLVKLVTKTRDQRSNDFIYTTVRFLENQTVDGIVFPKLVEISINDNLVQKIEINKIEINKNIDNSLFAFPK